MGGALVDLEAPPGDGEEGWNAPASAGAGRQPGVAAAKAGSGDQQGTGAGAGGPRHPAQRVLGRVLVPRFNSAVFFRVPHWHTVTPLTTDRPR